MGKLAKNLSGAIGFATEAYAHRGDSKPTSTSQSAVSADAKAYPTHNPTDEEASSGEDYDSDETDWVRDETQEQLPSREQQQNPTEKDKKPRNINDLVAKFLHDHPLEHQTAVGQLPCPVIIPQRRPGSKLRGFVRAYAPVLGTCGIGQATFMDFHETLHSTSHGEGFFHVANIAVALSVLAEAAAVAPSIIVHTVALMVHASIEAGRRLYVNKQSNNFLDQMNESFFKPRGLYAMIMTYNPDSPNATEMIDIESGITQAVEARTTGGRSKYHSASGKTTEAQMPEAAPLVFPDLQNATDEQKTNAFKKASAFAGDYKDRRAQATFDAKHPVDQLSGPPQQQEWSSRWADPNHPVNNGGLLGVISGGYIDPRARRVGRRGQMNQKLSNRGIKTIPTREERQTQKAQDPSLIVGNIRKLRKLQENVLYLMIVNMPSEAEMREAASIAARSKP